jgi:AAHS family 4-hydroxybenzoate transporter-like MFS transporter
MTSSVLDITKLIDEQKVGAFTTRVVIISFLIMLFDGYDLLAASYGAPALVADWHIQPAQLGPVFSVSPFGMVLGAPLLGWFGDKFGRRRAIIFGALLFGGLSLACATATTIPQLMAYRFVTGIGLGGMMPNITALNAEFAPKRLRATLVVVMFSGVAVGGSLPGLVVASLPSYGWQGLYVIGGVVPLALALVIYFQLPESIKFLCLTRQKDAQQRIAAIVNRLRPDLRIAPDTVFVTSEGKSTAAIPVTELFEGGLKWITPLLWSLFIINLMINYFLYSWMPIVFRSSGFSSSQAALTTACYYVGGVLGGVVVSRFIDQRGLVPVTLFFLAGCLFVSGIGLPNLPAAAVSAFVFAGGFCVLGVQLGLNAASGLIYPTRIRASGAGWAMGMGRFGGIVGPMLGAWLISMKLPTFKLFLAPAVPLALGALLCLILVHLCRQRFHGDRLDEAAALAAGPAG